MSLGRLQSPSFALVLWKFGFIWMIAFSCSQVRGDTLKFLTWEDYISPELVSGFEKQYGVSLEFVYFQHDEERDDLLAASQHGIYDLFIVDGQSLADYKRLGWIAPVTQNEIPELAKFDGAWREIRPEAAGTVMPYGWGTLGLAYRKDIVTDPVTSLMDVFEPRDSMIGKIIMSPQVFELVPSAILALGYPMGYGNPKAMAEAKTLLLKQQQYVHSYQALVLNESSPLVTGDVVIAQAYNSDALALADIDDNIAYVVPKEGSPIWIDFLAVSSGSKKKQLAYKFLRFLSQVENVRKNIEYTYTANFHSEAIKSLSQEVRDNETIFYPTPNDLFVLESPNLKTIRRIMDISRSLNMGKQ